MLLLPPASCATGALSPTGKFTYVYLGTSVDSMKSQIMTYGRYGGWGAGRGAPPHQDPKLDAHECAVCHVAP